MGIIKYDMVIAYRIYPQVSRFPMIYENNKYKLSELCLRSFKKALGVLNVKLIVIMDNCPEEYVALFKKYFAEDSLEIVRVEGIGNKATFAKQIELLIKQDYSEIIYFAEDDYYYLPDGIVHMFNYLNNNKNIDFVSAYDHFDLYYHKLHDHNNYIKIYDNRHWRTANSTCLTFMTNKNTLIKTKNVFLSYFKGNPDASLWISLTKYKLNIFMCLIYYFCDRKVFSIIVKAWYYCWPYILFGKERKLWIPIPSLGTHVEKKYLAPTIEWQKIMRENGISDNHS